MSIAITAAGLVSCLGMDIANAAAAARAGIARTTELNYVVRSAGTNEPEFVCGHAVPFGSDGFEGDARLARLLAGALVDLARQCTGDEPGPPSDWYLSLPDPNRVHSGFELMPDEQTRADVRQSAAGAETASLHTSKAEVLSRKAAAITGFRTNPALRFVSRAGHAGVGEALQRAMEDLAHGYVRRALVAGVDSLVDGPVLAWLNNCKRLKSSAAPTGLRPGEAAVAFVLEEIGSGGGGSSHVVTNVALELEERPLLEGAPPTGTGLARLLRAVPADASSWLITDQNGEEYRAREWGTAVVRALPGNSDYGIAGLRHPAIGFGDTGAAAGGVALCLGLQALERGYAPRESFTVLSCSEGPLRSSISIRKFGAH